MRTDYEELFPAVITKVNILYMCLYTVYLYKRSQTFLIISADFTSLKLFVVPQKNVSFSLRTNTFR